MRDGSLIEIIEDREWNLVGFTDHVLRVQTQLMETGRYPLIQFLRGLGIADVMIHPAALEKGELRRVQRMQPSWSKTWIGAQLSYGQYVPERVLDALRQS